MCQHNVILQTFNGQSEAEPRFAMVMKTYGKWLPNTDVKTGYQLIYPWENAQVFPIKSAPNQIVTLNATLKNKGEQNP